MPVVDEPLHAALEPGELVHDFRLQRLDGKQWNEAHHRTQLHGERIAIPQMQHVVVKAVLFVPHPHAVLAEIIHRMRDVQEVLPKLARDIFISGIFPRQFERDREEVQGIHRHPACPVRLLDMPAGRQRRTPVEHADIVQP